MSACKIHIVSFAQGFEMGFARTMRGGVVKVKSTLLSFVIIVTNVTVVNVYRY